MADFPAQVVLKVFASPFVDDDLFLERLGGPKSDPAAIDRYLALPIAARPEVAPFFDREFYWQRYPDMRHAEIDPLVHFMGWGVAEKRTPHPLINIAHMLGPDPDILSDPITIDSLHAALVADKIDPGPFFSLDFYRRQIAGLEPTNGGLLKHFLQTGLLLGLKPNASLDPLAYYRGIDTKTFDVRSALRHFVLAGGAPARQVAYQPTSEDQAKSAFRAQAETAQLFRGRTPLRFDIGGTPDISVVMVVHNNFALTLQSLTSLRANYQGAIELILIDSGSTDEVRHLSQYVTGACLLRFETNISFVRGCNAGLEIASAGAMLYLNNDVILEDGAIAAALRRLHADPAIGAVGAKVIRTHGLLQEAGCMLWNNGWTEGYLRDRSPLAPEANFVRDVDVCSAVFLLVRTDLVRDLRGFDTAFAPAYFEDADLCIRIRDAGFRVVYDPAVTLHHLEYGTSPASAEVHARIARGHDIFRRKHQDKLTPRLEPSARAQLFARSNSATKGRVLLIEDQLPLRRLGSGFVRSNDIVGIMAGLGYHVTVYPIHPNKANLAALYMDFPDTVEVMHDHGLNDLQAFLEDRAGYYNTIWIARTHNLDLVKPILERAGDAVRAGVKIVLDTEAISATRLAQQHILQAAADPFDAEAAVRKELANAPFCDAVVAVNDDEAQNLRALGLANVKVVGHVRTLAVGKRDWGQRAGMLFVGAIHTSDSPNYDSLCWFADEVLPFIEQELRYETRLTIAGFLADGVDLNRFRDHPRISLRGAVADLAPLYDSHRVFVAPTRFAAGIPYKIHEAASYGLPVVATEILREQLQWDDGQDLLAADPSDPAGFARHVVALYRSQGLWNSIQAGAASRIASECARAPVEAVVAEILA